MADPDRHPDTSPKWSADPDIHPNVIIVVIDFIVHVLVHHVHCPSRGYARKNTA